MNEDFSDVIDKFKSVLASKDIDLSGISKALGNEKPEENSSGFDFDIETIIKLKNIISSAKNQNSPSIRLLEDLRPFLNPDARKKLDELIKLAKILALLEILNKNDGMNLLKRNLVKD